MTPPEQIRQIAEICSGGIFVIWDCEMRSIMLMLIMLIGILVISRNFIPYCHGDQA